MARDLPIYEVEQRLVAAARAGRRIVLQAPTGSGKSTQVPQMLLDHGLLGDGQVVVLQPRRLPARMLAARVAQERNVRLGGEVGYQIRFDNITSRDTRIRFVTEGLLLRQMLSDPDLRGVRAILFDEFHERHLYGDITLARALELQEKRRPDLLIVVMSATLAVQQLESYLAPCETIASSGRTYPVDIGYLEDLAGITPRQATDMPVWELAAEACAQAFSRGAEGDALVFMPGAYEISRTMQALQVRRELRGCAILPLHGELSEREQDLAVARASTRKVIVSTNVAETSLTIDGVRVVIDAGLARVPRFDPYRGINTLLIERISRASADQRAGRAGRTAPGRCLRLWTQQEHQGRPMQELPEVRRIDLAEVVLTLKASGVDDLRAFRWLEPPEPRSLDRAELLLRDLGALDEQTGIITDLGRRMLAFPLHPRYARMLVEAQRYDCVFAVSLVAALTQGRDLLLRRPGKPAEDARADLLGDGVPSDFLLLIRAWQFAEQNNFSVPACQKLGIHAQSARQVRPLLEQFVRIARDQGLPADAKPATDEALQKCLLTGFIDQLARRVDRGTLRCQIVHGRKGELARESAIHHAELLVAAEVHEIEGRDRELNVLLSLATEVKPEWLRELFPQDFQEKDSAIYDTGLKRVLGERQVLFRDLVIEARRLDKPPADAAAELLAKEIIAGRLSLPQWDNDVDQWVLRLNFLAKLCPDLQLPPIGPEDREHLIATFCHGAVSHKELKDKPLMPVLRDWLNPSQAGLIDKYAPERFELPNGRRAKITYVAEGQPFLSARIADLYDVRETPRVAMGRAPLLLHILAPNQRPVQITQDLAGFWRDHYPRVKSELARKYPKHEWR